MASRVMTETFVLPCLTLGLLLCLPCQSVRPTSISPWAWLWATPTCFASLPTTTTTTTVISDCNCNNSVIWTLALFQYKRIVNRDSLCNCSNISTDSLSSSIRDQPTPGENVLISLPLLGSFQWEKLWKSGPFINLFTNRSSRQQEKNENAFLMCWKWWWINGAEEEKEAV